MNPYTVVAYASLAISIATAIVTFLRHKHDIRSDFTTQLETRIEALERELHEAEINMGHCETHNKQLLKENIELLRRLTLKNGE